MLYNHALTWYLKYSSDHPNAGITAIQDALDKEFDRPKSETQSVIGFKDIAILLGETSWDLDQRIKNTIHEANMTSTNAQHYAWFVASLMPHQRIALSQ